MDFLGAVNRVMRAAGIFRGDDDAVISFADMQHKGTISLAQMAIQTEINQLLADRTILALRLTGGVATLPGVRAYALPADFGRFWGDPPLLYSPAENRELFRKDEDELRQLFYDYRVRTGSSAMWWYDEPGAVAFYPVPSNVQMWVFDYEKRAGLTLAGDALPFTEPQAQTFCDLAARRFKVMFEDADIGSLFKDPVYQDAQVRLLGLLRTTNPPTRYGHVYRA